MNTLSSKLLGITLLLIILIQSSVSLECSSPCIPDYPDCQESFCDPSLGVCITQALPVTGDNNCCKRTTDCFIDDSCISSQCDFETNQCIREDICYSDDKACSSTKDCDDGNQCTVEKCIDGVCVTSATSSDNPNCCNFSQDCPRASKCYQASCVSFRCVYTSIFDCDPFSTETYVYIEIPSNSSSNDNNGDGNDAGVGDYIGSVIGFIFIGLLFICLILVIILLFLQKAVRGLFTE